MNPDVTKSISEAAPKKRGRPPVFGREVLDEYKRLYPDLRTRRSLQEEVYRSFAIHALDPPDERWRWLWDREAALKGLGTWKPGILAALGRVGDDESIRALATSLSLRKPSTKAAIACIRRWRLGRAARRPGLETSLTARLARVVDAYRTSHPDCTTDEIFTALQNVADFTAELSQEANDA